MNAASTLPLPQPCALVVDDDKDTADTVALCLEQSGMEVMVAYNAPDGLAIVRAHHPAVVVTDLDMPLMSGLDEARAIRALPGGQDVCLIALTGSDHLERPASAAGFDHFFVKPGNIARLRAIVSAACLGPARCGG